jgi:hypothetical protein
MILIPTQSMTSDPLTKVMISRPLLSLMSTGQVNFVNEPGHAIEARRLPKIKDFTEDDLELGDDKWLESYMPRTSRPSSSTLHHKVPGRHQLGGTPRPIFGY